MKNTEAKGNYILIYTDGYSISEDFFDTFKEAQERMKKEYSDASPEEWEEDWEELSSLGEEESILYNNGEDVLLWKIIRIVKE